MLPSFQVIRAALASQFPAVPVYLVLGNHDFPGSPVGPGAAAWYEHINATWTNRWLDDSARAELSQHGYYSTVPPSAGAAGGQLPIRLIMLNTEHFNHGNEFVIAGDTVEAALAQLAWLNDTLAATAAAGHRAYVIGHVPIGLETAYGNDRRVPSSLRPYWMDLFARRYQAIMDSYGEAVVAVQIFGHEHVDTFRLLGDKTVYGNCDTIWNRFYSRAFRKASHPPGTRRVLCSASMLIRVATFWLWIDAVTNSGLQGADRAVALDGLPADQPDRAAVAPRRAAAARGHGVPGTGGAARAWYGAARRWRCVIGRRVPRRRLRPVLHGPLDLEQRAPPGLPEGVLVRRRVRQLRDCFGPNLDSCACYTKLPTSRSLVARPCTHRGTRACPR